MTSSAGRTENGAPHRNRHVIMTTCQAHAAAGFTNLLVTKEDDVIVGEPAPRELLRAAIGRASRNSPAGHPGAVAGVRPFDVSCSHSRQQCQRGHLSRPHNAEVAAVVGAAAPLQCDEAL